MQETYRTVKLLQNHLYPTYQLHAYMANRKTTPQDGLRFAALSTMEWLLQRLGDTAPAELMRAPEPSLYQEVDDDALISLYMNSGFVIDIVSLPAQGIWSLQITEPDLGSDPGNPQQLRQAIPGRIIESNIGFRIVGAQLECGFQTMVSDPDGTEEPAEVYRLAIIRRLIDHPDFGLKQLSNLTYEVNQITTVEQLKTLCNIWRNEANQLPCVVFTRVREETPKIEAPILPSSRPAFGSAVLPSVKCSPQKAAATEPAYDMVGFSKSGVTFCRTYLLADALLERCASSIGNPLSPGDIILLEPVRFGGCAQTFPYLKNAGRREETMEVLRRTIYNYPRGKNCSFGGIAFLSAARENLLHRTEAAIHQSQEVSGQWSEKLTILQAQWNTEIKKRDDECAVLSLQLERQRQYQDRIENEKEQLRNDQTAETKRYRAMLENKDETIFYLRRKLSQPKEHSEVAAWVTENFSGRLLLHPKAIALLAEKPAKAVSIDLICDALDFLATDYWERRYCRISDEEMKLHCSEKYGRPFEVKPTGKTTIEFTPAQYKVKYFHGALGKPVESPLDFHLCVGKDSENLLRIYFLHDDEKQLIVVGSLPQHLRAVTIK